MACFSTFTMNINSMTSNLEQIDAQPTTYVHNVLLNPITPGWGGGEGGQHSPLNLLALSAAISLEIDQPTPFLTFTITSGEVVFNFFVISTKKTTAN